jgi:hypothetical protein
MKRNSFDACIGKSKFFKKEDIFERNQSQMSTQIYLFDTIKPEKNFTK